MSFKAYFSVLRESRGEVEYYSKNDCGLIRYSFECGSFNIKFAVSISSVTYTSDTTNTISM